jgi:Sulfatase
MSQASSTRTAALLVLGGVAALTAGCSSEASTAAGGTSKPNILFIVMDDVGIDQMAVFGYGGPTPPATPSIAAVAGSGVRFSNTWAMPACSVSRAVFFDGRFPVRTNVYGALGPLDLANSMVSPYEMTAPKLLAKSGYQSALFGKFHLAMQGNNPAGLAMPHSLGWNYFYGWLDETGDPSSIDTTAGGVAPLGAWSCGFVRGAAANGADSGACYVPDGTCTELTSSGSIPPGRTCRDQGGILDPNQICQPSPPSTINFDTLSAHYVSPLVINDPDGSVVQVPSTDPRARKFRAGSAVDSAVGWINGQPAGKPWMATVSFASAHTPVMQPPVDQEPAGTNSSDLDCNNGTDQQLLTDLLIESMDTQIARLLVETGLATKGPTGELVYAPEKTNTMLIIVGDNGTLGSAVKAPFDATRAKGTAYQTGVWVPLIVAGPLVNIPGRAVSSMVNVADIFELFGEIAGLDVHETVPRTIDSMSMLPYLSDPNQPSIRSTNFSQVGVNLQVGGALNGPCLFGGRSCSQIPVSKSVCEDNAGTWYGNGSTMPGVPAGGLARCCNVVELLVSEGATALPNINPDFSAAVRNDDYKLVQNKTLKYVAGATPPCVETLTNEFYAIDEAVPVPVLDKAGSALSMTALTPIQQTNYDALLAALNAQLAVTPSCSGDGNTDGVVDQQDITDCRTFEAPQGWGESSIYDLNFDGITDTSDEAIITEGMGMTCASPGSAG